MNKNLIATILIVIAVGLYFTITDSMVTDARTVKAKNDELQTAFENATKIIEVKNEVARKFQSISEVDRANIDKMIPNTVDNIRLVIDLNNLAQQNRIQLTNLRAGGSSAPTAAGRANPGGFAPVQAAGLLPTNQATGLTDPVLDKIAISFSATATFEQFREFLRDMEVNMRIMDLTHLTVTAADNGVYNFDAQYQTYWLRQ